MPSIRCGNIALSSRFTCKYSLLVYIIYIWTEMTVAAVICRIYERLIIVKAAALYNGGDYD